MRFKFGYCPHGSDFKLKPLKHEASGSGLSRQVPQVPLVVTRAVVIGNFDLLFQLNPTSDVSIATDSSMPPLAVLI